MNNKLVCVICDECDVPLAVFDDQLLVDEFVGKHADKFKMMWMEINETHNKRAMPCWRVGFGVDGKYDPDTLKDMVCFMVPGSVEHIGHYYYCQNEDKMTAVRMATTYRSEH